VVEARASVASRASRCARPDARWVSERIIAQVFGPEFADGVSAHELTAPSIFPTLLPRYRSGDPRTGHFPDLAPSPIVDDCLSRLVAIARGELDRHIDPRLRSPLHELEVRERVIARIHADSTLHHHAEQLRRMAALAEAALEHHYSARLLEALHRAHPPWTGAASGARRLQRLIGYVSGFPYVDNYLHLVRAELALLRAETSPVFVRDRELARLSPSERRAVERARRAAALARLESARAFPLRERSFVVCGCGPLPLTGLMLHASTSARVTLLDRDPESARSAQGFVEQLERLHVLDRGAVRVVLADAAAPSTWFDAHDVVLVASLVPNPAKLELARALPAAAGGKPLALLLRSAAGLCAELVYEAVPTAQISSPALPFCGESVPAHQVAAGLTASAAAVRKTTAPASTELVAVADPSVLNTTELYRSIAESIETGA
jgi:hypothetical protein